ncbi:MAG: alpha/beta hydrolase [Bacteroidales bacterium]|nr:alpha/beta hydrolase [Bacteroidales bacterium]
MKSIKAIITLALAAFCTCSFAQNYAKSEVVEDGGTGPYKAIMVEEPSLEAHTILRPTDLTPFNAGNPLPVLVWGNGACTNSPWEHINFLSEIASHGFIVVATGFIPLNGERYRGPQSTSAQQIEGIDWVFKVNEDPSSIYYHKLDTKNIALAGMSCGGLQTLDNCQDPRLKTIMICNSGLFSDPSTAVPGMPMPAKEKLLQIHTPVMYLLGGPEDIAYANGMDDFHRIDHVPAFAANYPVGHGGTYAQPHGGEFAVIATAWLEWQLKGDAKAGAMFLGNPCGVAQREGWTAEKKNID